MGRRTNLQILQDNVYQKWKPLIDRLSPNEQVAEATKHALYTNENMDQSSINWTAFKNIELKMEPVKANIEFATLMSADIRICEVLSVEKVAKANKLYKMEINTGLDTRIVVSAIADKVTPEQLLNKKIAFVLNLEPREIRGITSHAMILASQATDGAINPLYGVNVGDVVI